MLASTASIYIITSDAKKSSYATHFKDFSCLQTDILRACTVTKDSIAVHLLTSNFIVFHKLPNSSEFTPNLLVPTLRFHDSHHSQNQMPTEFHVFFPKNTETYFKWNSKYFLYDKSNQLKERLSQKTSLVVSLQLSWIFVYIFPLARRGSYVFQISYELSAFLKLSFFVL